MSYVQIIELVTREPEKMKALGERYLSDTAGRHKVVRAMIYHDRAEPRRYVAIVEFASREDAMENDNLPESEEFAEGLAEVSDGQVIYRNLELAYDVIP